MKIIMKKNYIWLILATLFVSACNQPADDPEVIAKRYWYLIQTGDYQAAEEMVSKNTRDNFQQEVKQIRSIEQVEFDKAQTNIRTTLNPSTNHPALDQPFSTVLILEEGKWKIDAAQTRVPVEPSIAEQEKQKRADEFSQSMKKNLDSIDDAMRDGLEQLNDALRTGSKDMGDSLLKAVQELNESMKESIEKMKQRKDAQNQEGSPQPDSKPSDSNNGEGMI